MTTEPHTIAPAAPVTIDANDPEGMLTAFLHDRMAKAPQRMRTKYTMLVEVVRLFYDKFSQQWYRPQHLRPHNGEIVLLACEVKDSEGKLHGIFQAAVYELDEANNVERWHCGQPFELLKFWLRIPAVPTDTIIPVRKKLIMPGG